MVVPLLPFALMGQCKDAGKSENSMTSLGAWEKEEVTRSDE